MRWLISRWPDDTPEQLLISLALSSGARLSLVSELIAHQEGNLNVPELPGTARFSAQEETDRQQPDRQALLLLN